MFSANSSQVSDDKLFVEDVFSTWLYAGNGSTQTITNGIDLAGKGGLVWIKARSSAQNNVLADTANGTSLFLSSNTTSGQTGGSVVTAFSSTGFNTGGNTTLVAGNGVTYASWTFRKAPKFFDVVTYTGNGTTQNIAHNLGTAPGMIIIKMTSSTGNWMVYHRTQTNTYGYLNLTNAFDTTSPENVFGNNSTVVAPTATQFTIGDRAAINSNGATFVAYLFAHDTTSDGIIQCGSYSGTGSAGNDVTLGWEPQWLLVKRTDSTGANWCVIDNMRGFTASGNDAVLIPNLSDAEISTGSFPSPTSTGFSQSSGTATVNASGGTYVYIAIRRGPMRTPTSGTSVFSPIAVTPSSGTVSTTNFPTDMMLLTYRPGGDPRRVYDRLRGIGAQSPPPYEKLLTTNTTDAEADSTPVTYNWWNTGFTWSGSYAGLSMVSYAFRRAPSFFDEVCLPISSFSVNGNHNLGVAPEMIIGKRRDSTGNWFVYHTGLTGVNSQGKRNEQLLLNSNAAKTTAASDGYFVDGLTATSFETYWWPSSSGTAVLYLFASCPGVSKVGSYTGNGSSQTINCGFAAGARFVMIKRTDAVGNWCVWDTARGINPGGDPVLQLNNTFAEDNTTDDVDTAASGFVVNSVSPGYEINLNGATYIYLAVA